MSESTSARRLEHHDFIVRFTGQDTVNIDNQLNDDDETESTDKTHLLKPWQSHRPSRRRKQPRGGRNVINRLKTYASRSTETGQNGMHNDLVSSKVYNTTGHVRRAATPPAVCVTRYRWRLVKTFLLCAAFLSLGLAIAIPGPTLVDLQAQTNTSIGQISYIFTGRSIGYLIGSVLAGFGFDRLNHECLFGATLMASGCGTIAAPWCSNIGLLTGSFAFLGTAMGMLDTGGNVLCLQLWKADNGPYMQALHFSFGLGAFVAPLVAEPFLKSAVRQDVLHSGDDRFNLSLNDSMKKVLEDERKAEFCVNDIVRGTNGKISSHIQHQMICDNAQRAANKISENGALPASSGRPRRDVTINSSLSTTNETFLLTTSTQDPDLKDFIDALNKAKEQPDNFTKPDNSGSKLTSDSSLADGKTVIETLKKNEQQLKQQQQQEQQQQQQPSSSVPSTTPALSTGFYLTTFPSTTTSSLPTSTVSVEVSVSPEMANGSSIEAATNETSVFRDLSSKVYQLYSQVTTVQFAYLIIGLLHLSLSITFLLLCCMATPYNSEKPLAPMPFEGFDDLPTTNGDVGSRRRRRQPSTDKNGFVSVPLGPSDDVLFSDDEDEGEDEDDDDDDDEVSNFDAQMTRKLIKSENDGGTNRTADDNADDQPNVENCRPDVGIGFKVQIVVLLFFLYFLYVGSEVTYGNFLSAFAIQHFLWSKQDAAMVASLFWGTFALFRGVGIGLARCMSPSRMLIIDLIVTSSTLLAMCLTLNEYPVVLWPLTGLLGAGMATIFPSGVSWAERHFEMSGMALSVFVVGSALGEMVLPVVTGFLMQHKSDMFLVYNIFAASLFSIVLYIIMENLGTNRALGSRRKVDNRRLGSRL